MGTSLSLSFYAEIAEKFQGHDKREPEVRLPLRHSGQVALAEPMPLPFQLATAAYLLALQEAPAPGIGRGDHYHVHRLGREAVVTQLGLGVRSTTSTVNSPFVWVIRFTAIS